MLDFAAALVAVTLAGVAALHAFWGLGGLWPKSSAAELAATVVGTKGITEMPGRWLTLLVAALIGIAAIWPLMWRGLINYPHAIPQTVVYFGMWGLAAIFLIRGIGGILVPLSMTSEPFAQLNRWAYSPLCTALGLCYLWLVSSP